MSTQDNKIFIESLAEELGFDKKIKWKRLSKSKVDEGSLRVFGNNENDMQLTILEKHNGSLSLYNQDIQETSIQVTAKNLGDEKELLSFFMSDVIMTITNESLAYYAKEFQKDFDQFVEQTNNIFGLDKNKSLKKEDMLAFYQSKDPYFFIPYMKDQISTSDIDLPIYRYDFSFDVESIKCVDKFSPDKINIEYDKENTNFYLCKQNGVAFIMFTAGGDWEEPLTFYMYLDKDKNDIDFFFDFGNKDMYDVSLKQAYGNAEEDEDEERQEKIREKISQNFDKIQEKMTKKFVKSMKAGSNTIKPKKLKM